MEVAGWKEQQISHSQRFLISFLLFFLMVHVRGHCYCLSLSLSDVQNNNMQNMCKRIITNKWHHNPSPHPTEEKATDTDRQSDIQSTTQTQCAEAFSNKYMRNNLQAWTVQEVGGSSCSWRAFSRQSCWTWHWYVEPRICTAAHSIKSQVTALQIKTRHCKY